MSSSGSNDEKGNLMLGKDTELLVLAAPLSWWPSSAHLHRHPLEARRTFFSSITSAGVAVGAVSRVVALSRLGRSVMLSGTLMASEAVVQLYDPFSGEDLLLSVCGAPGGGVPNSDISLHSLVVAERVRIEAAPVARGVRLQDVASELENERNSLGGRYVLSAIHHIDRQLQRKQKWCAVLFTGEHGVGKTHEMYRAVRAVPLVVEVHGVHCVVECRDLSIVALLQLDEREAVEVIRCVFTPPSVDMQSGMHGAMLLVAIDAVELLCAASNTLVALVTHQLCTALDELHEMAGCHIVTLSTAANITAIPAALVARLSSHRVHVVCPSPDERLRCIDAHNNPAAPFLSRVKARVAEVLAGRTAGQLAVTDGATFLELLEREAALDAKQKNDNSALDVYEGFIGLRDVIRDLEELAVWPLLNLPLLRLCNISSPKGLVLCGPPGSGKTALLKALARRLQGDSARGVHVMLADGLQLVEKEVGRTEKNIAALFATARATAPTALFLDNIDSLAPPRGRQMGEVSSAADRALSTLLTEMDGVSSCSSGDVVFIVASAPCITALDPAISRPGRLDLHLMLPLPASEELRLHIVRRLMACLRHLDGTLDAEAMAATATAVEAHVDRWVNGAWHVTMAEANDLVREVVLQLAETPTTVAAADRLLDALGAAAPL